MNISAAALNSQQSLSSPSARLAQSGTSSISDIHSGDTHIDEKKAIEAVNAINKKLKSAPTQVVSFFDTKSNRIWLNVVDKSTGKIISEIPPEAIRKIVDDYATVGLNVDKFR